jgi:hypothetical protein
LTVTLGVPVDRGLEGAAGLSAAWVALEDELDVLGAAQVEVVGHQGLEAGPGVAGSVQHDGAGGLHLPHGQVPPEPAVTSAAQSGSGSREVHRLKNTRIVPGPSRSQIACRAAGSSAVANPLDSSVKPIPALVACRLAHSWPLTPTLIG